MIHNKILQEDVKNFAHKFALANELNGKTIAVTGATGLLGSCMVRCLLALHTEKGIDLHVIAVVRNIEKAARLFGKECKELSFYTYDFSSTKAFKPSKKTDFIVHFAAPTASKCFINKPVETMNTIYFGTQNILSYSQETKVTSLVFVSSMEVYGAITDDKETLTEQMQGYLDPMATRSSYPLAKRAAEALCHNFAVEHAVPVKVARLAQTFGAGVDSNDNRVFAQFARSVIHNQNIVLHTNGEGCHSYCYTTDAVSAMLYLLLRGEDGEAYNVANSETYISIRKMAELVAESFNPNNVKVVIQLQEGMGYPPTTKLRLDTKRIHALGWKAEFGLKEMFSRLIDSMKEIDS